MLSYNLMGEGIRDALDPRLRQSRVGRILRLGRAARRLARTLIDKARGGTAYCALAGAEVAELADAHV